MSDEVSFADLIGRVRAGDAHAAAEVVQRYEPAFRRAVRLRLRRDPRLCRLLDSVDICQSVMASFFVRAALGQYELSTPAHLVKLLATIARNKVINQARKQRAACRDPGQAARRPTRSVDAAAPGPGPCGGGGAEGRANCWPRPCAGCPRRSGGCWRCAKRGRSGRRSRRCWAAAPTRCECNWPVESQGSPRNSA